jgi:hypothetical protein
MSAYRQMIVEDTGCKPADAAMIEYIMREDIFHSTLNWQTRAEFRSGAHKAANILAEDRPLYEEHFAKTRAVFEQMRQAAIS